MALKLRIFCDFDGTIAKNDVGNLVFTTFGDAVHWWQLVADWKKGLIDARTMWREQARILRMSSRQLDEFAAEQEIDATFPAFVEFCRERRYPLYVVSDGMDAYIDRILKSHNVTGLIIRSNHLTIAPDASVKVAFPYYHLGCGTCANCKGFHVRSERRNGETTVYIGDGHSDVHGLTEADITFAKGDLLAICRATRAHCKPFDSFADVQFELTRLAFETLP